MSELTKQVFGTLPSGEDVYLYTFQNANGLRASITNLGGRIVAVTAPDRSGAFDDVVLGFDDLAGYLQRDPYFGAIVGRYANRIANAQFSLDGQTYKLARNAGSNSLHGGLKGFDHVVWQAKDTTGSNGPALELTYLSVDGEEGYPGNLAVTVTYSLNDRNQLRMDYRASTDRKTVLNLTNHSYFDLSGQGKSNVADHVMTINADRFTPVDEHLIPAGAPASVDGTPFDFREPRRIGDRIDEKNEQMKLGLGYDHNFVLNRESEEPSFAARAVHPASGRVLEVFTTQPGVQFYTGNHLTGAFRGKGGAVYGFRTGFCLETQHFPNSPNRPDFPSTELSPGEEAKGTTIFKLSVEK
jgi:aldose 1-epimerase